MKPAHWKLEFSTKDFAKEYFQKLTEALGENKTAEHLWRGDEKWRSPIWTAAMTLALGTAANAVFDAGHIAGKGVPDTYLRREYLTLDLTAYDNNTWAAPTIIVEHENSNKKLEYCAWKLLSVYAQYRVLVAYYNWEGYATTSDELEKRLQAVLNDQDDRELILIAGNWKAQWGHIFDEPRVLRRKK